MIGTYCLTSKVLKYTKVYVFGWDVTELRSSENKIIRYLHSKYDEFAVLIILACISAIFNIAVCLLFGTVGEVISMIDMLLSMISSIILLNENKSIL